MNDEQPNDPQHQQPEPSPAYKLFKGLLIFVGVVCLLGLLGFGLLLATCRL